MGWNQIYDSGKINSDLIYESTNSYNLGLIGDLVWHTIAETCSTGGTDNPSGTIPKIDFTPEYTGYYLFEADFISYAVAGPYIGWYEFRGAFSLKEINSLGFIGSQSHIHHKQKKGFSADPGDYYKMSGSHHMWGRIFLIKDVSYSFRVMKLFSAMSGLVEANKIGFNHSYGGSDIPLQLRLSFLHI